ncbi:MAG: zinc-ribbon domain-containing protein, partial [Lachnospiraceae bacterium]|nr:zinc-ribbon domain-containing protein [Lachnospiraceae bacterium]
MKTMFCTNCGAKIQEGARFCSSCGTRLNTSPAGQQGAPRMQQQIPPQMGQQVPPRMGQQVPPQMQQQGAPRMGQQIPPQMQRGPVPQGMQGMHMAQGPNGTIPYTPVYRTGPSVPWHSRGKNAPDAPGAKGRT